ncbi:ribosomal protein L4/L1 family-domain-containing protein [Melampsora americana]|nr:ribosomal protein L4/L1 family-domain-containing protein [Melampsora americana]
MPTSSAFLPRAFGLTRAFTTSLRSFESSSSSLSNSFQSAQLTEGITHGSSVQHLMIDRFDLSNPDATFDQPSVFPLSKYVFGQPSRPDIIHRCVMFERSLMRSGSANTKTRSEVATSGRKLRPQKGTGRARIGDASSPTLRKGGVAFGPKPKDWSQGIQRKVWELGLRTVLSQRWRDGNLILVDRFSMNDIEYGSEQLAELITQKGWSNAMIIAGGDWGTPESGWKDGGLLRQALGRDHLITPGIRLGQTGSWWTQQQKALILPCLNNIDLAHPQDFQPGKPHTTDWRPGRVGIYHLLLREKCIMDIEAIKYLEHKLTWDLRRPISALGVSKVEADLQHSLASNSLASLL